MKGVSHDKHSVQKKNNKQIGDLIMNKEEVLMLWEYFFKELLYDS